MSRILDKQSPTIAIFSKTTVPSVGRRTARGLPVRLCWRKGCVGSRAGPSSRLWCFCTPREGVFLVTGAAGFIGSHVIEQLVRSGADVVAVDNLSDQGGPYPGAWKEANMEWLRILAEKSLSSQGSLKFLTADITNRAAVEEIFAKTPGIAYVCHLAGISGVASSLKSPEECIAVNVGSTALLMDCAGKSGCKSFVFASSGSVYGDVANASIKQNGSVVAKARRPAREEDATGRNLLSPYAASKMSAELMADVYRNIYDLHITILRVFTVYGPRGRPDMAIQRFAERMLAGDPIQQHGSGESFRDYVYVEDVARAFIKAMRCSKKSDDNFADNNETACKPCKKWPEVYNIAGGEAITLSEIIKLVEQATGVEAVVQVEDSRAADVSGTFACIDKAAEGLGWVPEVLMPEGLERTVHWMIQERDTWLQHKSSSI